MPRGPAGLRVCPPQRLGDPFDRMLIAQALGADLILVSNEALFDGYGVRRLW
jgi:PIN domain nuclease of toxin-antitoxin system